MNRVRISWRLVRISARLLRHNRDLLIFPILAVTVTLIVIVAFLGVTLATVEYDVSFLLQRQAIAKLAALFFFYLIAYFIIFFSNTGIVGAVMIYLNGGRPTLSDSFHIAKARLRYILGYALIMATVGMVFRLIFRRTGATGRLLSPVIRRALIYTVVGIAWGLIPYLVVPILVVENVGPIQAMKRSTSIIKAAWGEQVVGYASIGLIFWLVVAIPALAGGIALSWAASTANLTLLIGVLYVTIMVILTAFLFKTALESIFSALVYCYATGTLEDEEFDIDAIRHVFQNRNASWLQFGRRKKSPELPEAAGPVSPPTE